MSIRRRRLQKQFTISPQALEPVTKQLGSLAIIQWFLERLGIAELIDRCCPVSNQANLTHGEVNAAMVANRLTAPRPLHRVETWAAEWAVEDTLGIPAGYS